MKWRFALGCFYLRGDTGHPSPRQRCRKLYKGRIAIYPGGKDFFFSNQSFQFTVDSTMDFTFHPGTNGSSPWVDFYPYVPSRTAGYAFMALFGISTVAHFVLMFPYRAAYFIPLLLGGVCK